ncbi:MAG: hypothetical protein ACXAC2_17815 [Candidatus Kariarchaeaceae archaeon]|jgi:predicted metal-dependent hydrolase
MITFEIIIDRLVMMHSAAFECIQYHIDTAEGFRCILKEKKKGKEMNENDYLRKYWELYQFIAKFLGEIYKHT